MERSPLTRAEIPKVFSWGGRRKGLVDNHKLARKTFPFLVNFGTQKEEAWIKSLTVLHMA